MVNKPVKEVERLLIDLVGAFFAQATIKKICGDMGIKPEDLSRPDLPDLADRIEKSVSYIKGKDKAARLAEQIREI